MKRRYFVAVALLAAVAGLSVIGEVGCGGGDRNVLAEVNGYEITQAEFEDYTRGFRRTYTTAEEEFDLKRDWLDSLIATRLLIDAAYEKNIDKLDEIARVVLANRDKFLLDVMYHRRIMDEIKVTEAEVRDYWEKLEYKVRAAHILLKDPEQAQAIFDSLVNGADFDRMAYEYSIDPQAKHNRGDLGYFEYGAMVEEFGDAAFSMKVGEISPPVKTPFGYHIIRLIDRQPNEDRSSFETMKPTIEATLRQRKAQRMTEEFYNEMKEKYAVTVDPAVGDYLAHKREELYPPDVLERLPVGSFDLEQLDRNEKELVLATWAGGQVTVGEYIRDSKPIADQLKPRFDNYDSLATVIFELKKFDILVYEANKMGYEDDPQFQRKIKFFKELSMADVMRNDSIKIINTPTDAESREYYDTHVSEFSVPAKVRVFEILLSDELKARKLAREIKSLEEFQRKAKELTERPAKVGTNGDLGYIQRRFFEEIFPVAWETAIGEIGGPVVNAGGRYSIFYVVDKRPESMKDYLSVKQYILSKLREKAKAESVAQWVSEHRSEVSIKIDDDAIWSTIDREAYDNAGKPEQG